MTFFALDLFIKFKESILKGELYVTVNNIFLFVYIYPYIYFYVHIVKLIRLAPQFIKLRLVLYVLHVWEWIPVGQVLDCVSASAHYSVGDLTFSRPTSRGIPVLQHKLGR